jgi:MFS family permease
MAGPSGWASIRLVFSSRDYRLFQIGRTSTQFTSWMYRIAIGWMVWEMTRSATWLGIFGFLDQAPALVITPLAGALSDRMERMKLLRWTQLLLVIQSGVLCVLVLLDLITLWNLALLTVFFGVMQAAQSPATQAIVPNLVPKEHLTAAYGSNSVLFNLSRFAGPVAAGFTINAWGTAPAIFANAAGSAVFALTLILIRTRLERPLGLEGSIFKAMGEGLRYASRHPGIRPMLFILSLLSVLTFSIDNLMPSLADGVFGMGAHGLAWMTAAGGVGAIFQAAHLAQRGAIKGVTNYVFFAILVMAIGTLVLSWAPWFSLALVACFFVGFSASAIRVGSITLLQYSVEPLMRGRVASYYSMIYYAGPALGSAVLGVIADEVGIRITLAGAGILTLALLFWGNLRRARIAAALETAAPER